MIHKYLQMGHAIVLDINSGAVHVVDRLTYDMLDYLQPPLAEAMPQDLPEKMGIPTEKLAEAYAELYGLFAQGLLFSADDYAPYAEQMVLSPVKAMCLNVSHDCNLRCAYCFAGKGNYGGESMVMSAETGKKAIDFLIAQSGDRQFLEVDFFGGEPLMNFDAVQEILSYAQAEAAQRGKEFRFTITTNGMLLDDEKIDYINAHMDNVVLSLDGRRTVTDKVRTRVNGAGCYDIVVPKFQKLVERRGDKEYYVRGTFTKWNIDFAEDVKAMEQLGFDQISVEPVVAGAQEAYALTTEDLPEIFAEYERLAELLVRKERQGEFVNFFHFMLDLDQGPCAIKRLRGCGCGNEYVAVTPDGDVYPCHQFIGQPQWKMGSVHDGSFDLPMKEQFAHATVYDKATCRDCWAKFYCSGGCNANNALYKGDVLSPLELSCELEKKRLECAIAIQAELALGGSEE